MSFNDDKGVWHCFRCGAGGSVFDLIMLAHNCDFLTALKFLAEEARIQLPTATTPEERWWLAEYEAQRKRIGNAASKLGQTEHELRLWYRNLIHHSEQKQDQVRQRLGELYGGAPERWRDEYEGCWAWLTALVPLLREHLAAYTLLAFGSAQDRARFVLRSGLRQQMISSVLEAGGCFDNRGKWTEVLA